MKRSHDEVLDGSLSCEVSKSARRNDSADVEQVRELLLTLNTRFRHAQCLATRWSSCPRSCEAAAARADELCSKMRPADEALCSELQRGPGAFEARRLLLEGMVPLNFVWHGPTSQQRILLQDERFLAITSNAETALYVVSTIVKGEFEGLRSLFLGALHSKLLLGYMLTAPPNWQCLPQLGKAPWDMAYAFVQHERLIEEDVIPMSPSLLQARLLSIANIARAIELLSSPDLDSPPMDKKSQEAEMMAWMEAPFEKVFRALEAVVSSESRSALLAQGPSGSSTDLYPMICQLASVMAYYDAAADHVGGGASVLSLGAFSHALDAKHVIAGLHALQRWEDPAAFPGEDFEAWLQKMPLGSNQADVKGTHRRGPLDRLRDEIWSGLQKFRALLAQCLSGEAEAMMRELMCCRLRQSLVLEIHRKHSDLDGQAAPT